MNEDEELVDINTQYREYLKKAKSPEGLSNWDVFQMELLKGKDNRLRKKFRKSLEADKAYWEQYPPVRTLFQYQDK